MIWRSVILVACFATSALAQCGCGCAGPQCLPAPSPYEALAAALAVPPPVAPPPSIPAEFYLPLGPILDGCGPPPGPLKVIQAPPVTVPGPESPVIPLPAPVLPPPQIIAHKCVVSKAVVKPQVYQRLVHVPTIARFLKKSFAPILENIAYTAVPQCGVAPALPPAPLAPLAPALPAALPNLLPRFCFFPPPPAAPCAPKPCC